MNEFEQQLVDRILAQLHSLEVKVTQELGKISNIVTGIEKENETLHREIRHIVEDDTRVHTQRLNKHSEEIDNQRERTAKIEEWKSQFEKQIGHRIAIGQSVAAVAAVVIAFLLSKFL